MRKKLNKFLDIFAQIIGWFFGVFFIISGLIYVSRAIFAFVLMVLLGLVLLPPVRNFLMKHNAKLFNKKSLCISSVILFILAVIAVPQSGTYAQTAASAVVPKAANTTSKNVELKLSNIEYNDGRYQLFGKYNPNAHLILRDSYDAELAHVVVDTSGKFEFKNVWLWSDYTKIFVYEKVSTGLFSSKQQQVGGYKYVDKSNLSILDELPIITKEVSTIKSIPFFSQTIESSSLEKGKTVVSQEGVDGEEKDTYKVTYKGSQEVGREQTGTEIIKQPINKITTEGTYVYVAPQPKPSPTQTQGIASGGRVGAICADGWQSSATGRGACSHHGGVSEWLY